MNICKNDEFLYKKIKNAMDMAETKGSYDNEGSFKSFYGPGTLINDWFEKRTDGQSQTRSSEPLLSENMDQFRPYCKGLMPDKGNYFNSFYDSFGLGQELLLDHLGFTYYKNYTTSYDLSYNHLKKGICGSVPRHYVKGRYVPETDLTKVYGNLTQWGLKERVYASMESQECEEPQGTATSETLSAFVAYDKYTVQKINDFKNFKKVKVDY